MGMSGLLVAVTIGLSTGAPAAGTSGEVGIWFNNSGKGAVEIRPCGTTGRDAKRLCGFIVWLKNPNGKNGQPLTDGYNSDPAKRRRPICGLPVLGALQRVQEGGYDNGWVYDPEQGQAFDAAIQLSSADKLVLTGYKGVKFFSKSFVWKRAPADLPRCSDGSAEREARGTTSTSTPAPDKAAGKATDKAKASAPTTVARTSAQAGAPRTPPRPVPAVRPRAPIE